MRKLIYSISALTLAFMLCASFFVTLFLIFQFHFAIGIGILAFFIFLTVLLLTDVELIRDEVQKGY